MFPFVIMMSFCKNSIKRLKKADGHNRYCLYQSKKSRFCRDYYVITNDLTQSTYSTTLTLSILVLPCLVIGTEAVLMITSPASIRFSDFRISFTSLMV